MNDITETQYIAVNNILRGGPLFGKIVKASDKVSAMIQFDLMNEPYTHVWLYIYGSEICDFKDD